MRLAIIGRSEVLYDTAILLRDLGHEVALVVTAKEAPEYTRTTEDFERLAEECGALFICTPNIKQKTEIMRSLPTIDIGVSVNYVSIIPQEVISIFRMGILNAHGGDLPRYQGNACQAWAILNGEKRIGLCIHKMVGGELDSGDIIARSYYDLSQDTKITEVYEWFKRETPKLFMDSLDLLEENPGYVLEKQSKDPADALRCYPRIPEDGRIDWSKSALEVHRLVNASNRPYSGAYCEYEGGKMVIWDSRLVEDQENYLAVPGQVTKVGEDFVEVACGQGKIRILEVEYECKIAPPSLFIKSIRKRLK